VLTELITDNCTSVRYEGLDDVLLKSKRKIEVRPCLVAVLEHWHAEDKVMDIFKISLALALVAQAKNDTGNFHVRQCHVVRCSGYHLGEVIRWLFVVLQLLGSSMEGETLCFDVTLC
jgi:hypothetical protein